MGASAFTQQTSGSTGVPKKITITRDQMITSAGRTLNALGIIAGDCALACLNPEYIAGKMMLARALEFNLKLEAVEPTSDPLQHLDGELINGFAAFVPLQLQTMLDNPQRINQLNQMKAVLVGGAPVSDTLEKKIKALTCPVYATYGMTETVSNIALQKLNGRGVQKNFITLPGITVQTDERSCLVIHLPGVPEPVITNDVAELQSETSFRILGRWDHVINTGGIKINPEQLEKHVEKILHAHGILRPFIIGSLPDEKLGEQLILLVEGIPMHPETEGRFIEKCKQQLEPYEVPRQIRYLNQFFYTRSGKINRQEILKSIR